MWNITNVFITAVIAQYNMGMSCSPFKLFAPVSCLQLENEERQRIQDTKDAEIQQATEELEEWKRQNQASPTDEPHSAHSKNHRRMRWGAGGGGGALCPPTFANVIIWAKTTKFGRNIRQKSDKFRPNLGRIQAKIRSTFFGGRACQNISSQILSVMTLYPSYSE